MHFQKEITCSWVSEVQDCRDQRHHKDVDREESQGDTSDKLIEADTVLHFDDIEPFISIKISPDHLVLVDEHCSKKGHEQNLEDEHEYSNIRLTDGHSELSEILVSIEGIEQGQTDLRECCTLIRELTAQEPSK